MHGASSGGRRNRRRQATCPFQLSCAGGRVLLAAWDEDEPLSWLGSGGRRKKIFTRGRWSGYESVGGYPDRWRDKMILEGLVSKLPVASPGTFNQFVADVTLKIHAGRMAGLRPPKSHVARRRGLFTVRCRTSSVLILLLWSDAEHHLLQDRITSESDGAQSQSTSPRIVTGIFIIACAAAEGQLEWATGPLAISQSLTRFDHRSSKIASKRVSVPRENALSSFPPSRQPHQSQPPHFSSTSFTDRGSCLPSSATRCASQPISEMDDQTSTQLPTPPYHNPLEYGVESSWNSEYHQLMNGSSSGDPPQAARYNISAQGVFHTDGSSAKGTGVQMSLQNFPESNPRTARASRSKVLASHPTVRKPTRQQRPKQRQASDAFPTPKRRKITLPAKTDCGECAVEPCDSVSESQSECCSSCPDSPPCDKSDCCTEPECVQAEEVIPCYEKACEKPACDDVCLRDVIRTQQSASNLPAQNWTEYWLNSSGSYVSGESTAHNIDPEILSAFNYPYNSVSLPPTSSAQQRVETFYSASPMQASPSGMVFPTSQRYDTQGSGLDSAIDATFSVPTWQDSQNHSANLQASNCLWNGCNEGQFFMTQQDWMYHLHQTHIDPQMTFGCPLQGETCPQTIGTNPLDHLQTEHGFNFDMNETPWSCPAPTCLPDETFRNPTMFHEHFDHAHSIPAHGSLQCRLEECNNTFVDPMELLLHINEHHKLPLALPNKKDHDIPPSVETASILASLPRAKPVKPEIVLVSDPGSETLAEKAVHACKWYTELDGICGTICASEEALQNHVKHNHLEQLDKSSKYKCLWEGCSRDSKRGENSGFSQRGKLERHMATHTGYKCCSCSICKMTFSAEQSLRQHMLLHTKEKPWKCRFCGKGFPQQSACTIHERTHTKEKPLECEICGKRFSESSNLSKHRKIHGARGLHNCDHPGCGKSFHRFDQLKRHKAMHERRMNKMQDIQAGTEVAIVEPEISDE